jgi:hypothetical protein
MMFVIHHNETPRSGNKNACPPESRCWVIYKNVPTNDKYYCQVKKCESSGGIEFQNIHILTFRLKSVPKRVPFGTLLNYPIKGVFETVVKR